MNRWQRIKKDRNYTNTLNQEEKRLYDKVIRQINETNKRLKQLEKGIDTNRGKYNPKTKRYERKESYQIINTRTGKRVTIKQANIMRRKAGTWASKKLVQKLDKYNMITNNKVNVPKGVNKFDLKFISKVLNNFLKSKTSTLEGINEVEEGVKNTISDIVDDIKGVTNEDIETLYDFYADDDFTYVTQYIDPSDLMVILASVKANNEGLDGFIKRCAEYIDPDSLHVDLDMRQRLTRVYNKFINI